MAASPRWKVFDKYGTYQVSAKEIEAAAAVISFYGEGAYIRDGRGPVVWVEGREPQPASESYDFVANTAFDRTQKTANETTPR